ncbi:Hypothetical protein PHPALM_9293, partial [Phytophthora palmivora]
MVYTLRVFLVTVTFALLQTQQTTATPLRDDPVTDCSSFDLNNKNFPGRGSEIEDDGTCTVIVPGDPSTAYRKLEGVSNDDIAELEEHFGTTFELKMKNLPISS